MASRARGRPVQTAVSDEELLDAALQSFGENGYDGASVREIARRLGVSHNLIPQRFGFKEKLWYAAVDHGFGRLRSDLTREAKTLGSDELLVLRGLIRSFIEINAMHPSLLQIINQEASQPGPRLDYLFDTYIKPVRDFGEAWLTRLAEEARIQPVSVSLSWPFVVGTDTFPASLAADKARWRGNRYKRRRYAAWNPLKRVSLPKLS